MRLGLKKEFENGKITKKQEINWTQQTHHIQYHYRITPSVQHETILITKESEKNE